MVPPSVQQQLERYRSLLTKVRPTFPENQARLLLDVFNGTIFQPWLMSVHHLHVDLEDAPLRYFETHGVDKREFAAEIKGLSFAEKAAVADAIERWWDDEDRTLSGVGLIDGG